MEDSMVVDGGGEPTLSTAEKRPIEIHHDDEPAAEPHSSKKPRNARDLGPNLRRVAEIVLVMSTMTALRAGKKPTDVEVQLMAEARAKLVQICEGLAPKDILGREAITSLIEDLGLHAKARDQKLGFRAPRLTITEKLAQSKKKMEDSKKYIPPPGFGSHPTQTNFTSSVENRGALPTVRMFPADKSSHVATSVGGTAAALPSAHVSVAGSTSIQVQAQLPINEVRSHIISSGFPMNHQGRDPSSLLHGIERPLNGTYGSQMQGNHSLANALTWSAQTQSTLSTKGVPEHKLPNHSAVIAQGSIDARLLRSSSQGPSSQAEKDQSFRPPISQTVTGNIAGLQPHLQSMNFVQGPSLSNNHNEIVKIIQKLLQPQLPDHPTWNPPSRDYMNKAVTCQTCQITINEIDSVLICDACEKGFHLKCVQSPNQRAIPRGEWHCPKCLTISNGKPLPPKYGRVMRSNPPPKLSVNTSGTQLSEKRLGAIEQKASVGQLNLVSNGGSVSQSPQPADHGSNANESSGTKIPDVEEIHGNCFLPIRKDIDEKPTSSTSLNTPAKSLELVCDPSSAELSSEKSTRHIKISQADIGEDGSSSKAEPPEESQTVADNSSNPKPPDISPIVDQIMVSNSPEKPYSSTSAHDTLSDKKDDHEVLQESNVENFEDSIINREQSIYQKIVSNSPEKPHSTASAHDTSSVKKDDHEVLQESNVEIFEDSIINREQPIYQKIVSNSPEKPYSTASAHDTSSVKKDDHEVLPESNVESFETSIINKEQSIYQKMASNGPEKPDSSTSAYDTSSVKKDDHEALQESNVENFDANIINREQSIYQKMASNGPEKSDSSASAYDTSSVKKDDHEALQESNVDNFDANIINREQSIYQMVSNSPEKPYSSACAHDTSSVKKDDHEVLQESNNENFEANIINRELSIYHKMVSNSPEKPYSSASAHDTSSVKKDDHEVLPESNVENLKASVINREQSGTSSDDLLDVEWIGMPHQVADGRAYYKSCRIDGVAYKVEEFALFHSSNGKWMPYRLQSMCHEFESGSNWAVLKKCYFYEDLPKEVEHSRPCYPEQNEVYTSDGHICLNVGLIRGPCEILPVVKYKEEYERRKQLDLGADNGVKPIFLCKWFYSEARKEFVPFTGAVCENLTANQI